MPCVNTAKKEITVHRRESANELRQVLRVLVAAFGFRAVLNQWMMVMEATGQRIPITARHLDFVQTPNTPQVASTLWG